MMVWLRMTPPAPILVGSPPGWPPVGCSPTMAPSSTIVPTPMSTFRCIKSAPPWRFENDPTRLALLLEHGRSPNLQAPPPEAPFARERNRQNESARRGAVHG